MGGKIKLLKLNTISILNKTGFCWEEQRMDIRLVRLVTNSVCYRSHLTQGLQNFRFPIFWFMVDFNPYLNKAGMDRWVDTCVHVCPIYASGICDQIDLLGFYLYLYCDVLGFQKCQLTIPYF